MASIADDILASYAADAAREVVGVRALVESHLPRHRGVRITGDGGAAAVEIHVSVEWGTSVRDVGCAVQARVREYLAQMADLDLEAVNVVIAEIGPPEDQ